jgi:hypothetical protein
MSLGSFNVTRVKYPAFRRSFSRSWRSDQTLRPDLSFSARTAPAPHQLFDDASVARFSLLHAASHHEHDIITIPTSYSRLISPPAMSNPLAEYLSALEARDVRERAHEEYIGACELRCAMMRIVSPCQYTHSY